ncbi:MAG: glycosyltransferase family 2 protein [Gemmatimonadota bacterium]|jgi:glycosyltransferase involved in cell wall biosynthesis|nr:glycosyltransferase family 2 protein [Gemmatimonadota bacterium]MDP6801563.1 glycosyltransferase family 2 protein [Gemmatimonadota bacterium]
MTDTPTVPLPETAPMPLFPGENRLRVDVVLPVYNEERILPESVATLVGFLRGNVRGPWRVLITDNASTDLTEEVARELAEIYPEVEYRRIRQKGRGGALKTVWLDSDAEMVSYMDVDLSTNLEAFPKLLELLMDGNGVAIGSRLSAGSDIQRSIKREFLSRGYNLLVKAFFGTRFSDAQCGFKAMTREAVERLVPFVEDRKWFFDTELLVLAEKAGVGIGEVPVGWIEDLDTRVQLLKTVRDDLRGLVRLRRTLRAVLHRIHEPDRR